jgi:hypothetical protein
MLGTISPRALLAGVGGGTLLAAAIYLVGYLLVAPSTGELLLVIALLSGLATGGWISGRLAPFNGRFHGSLSGLVIAGVVIVISRLGGSPAPASQVLLLAAIAIVVGGLAGWVAHRPDPRQS